MSGNPILNTSMPDTRMPDILDVVHSAPTYIIGYGGALSLPCYGQLPGAEDDKALDDI
jgi:hypothetical protein